MPQEHPHPTMGHGDEACVSFGSKFNSSSPLDAQVPPCPVSRSQSSLRTAISASQSCFPLCFHLSVCSVLCGAIIPAISIKPGPCWVSLLAALSAANRFPSVCNHLNILSTSEDQPPALFEVQSLIGNTNGYTDHLFSSYYSTLILWDIFHSDTISNLSDLHPQEEDYGFSQPILSMVWTSWVPQRHFGSQGHPPPSCPHYPSGWAQEVFKATQPLFS